MRAKIISIGDAKRNVKSDGWNCYVRVDDPSVKGVTVFGSSVDDILKKLGGIQTGDAVELEVERKGKHRKLLTTKKWYVTMIYQLEEYPVGGID